MDGVGNDCDTSACLFPKGHATGRTGRESGCVAGTAAAEISRGRSPLLTFEMAFWQDLTSTKKSD